MRKKHGWIGVDLDGTLADHYWPSKGQYDPLRIGDPVPAMVERVKQWLAEGYEVRVMTARVGPHGSAPGYGPEYIARVQNAILNWTEEHIGEFLTPTCTKDYNMIELWDDRAVRVRINEGVPCCDHRGA